jgi:CubicO group peptidase (beta-lactamase class C family)
MSRRRFALLTATSGLALPLAVRAADLSPSQVEAEMRWSNVPGVSMATVTQTSVHARQFGVRNKATQAPVTATTIFEAASLSKPVFAYAVCALVRSGTFDLDRPLDSYLPAPYPIDDPRAKTITARHVLMHTSGLPNWRVEDGRPLTLSFAPGAQYQYSGEGFYFLETAIEAVTGRSIEQFMRPALDGLGMRHSSYVWKESYAADCAVPYGEDGKPLRHDTQLLGEQLDAMGKASGRPLSTWKTAQALAALPALKPPQKALPHNAMPNVAWSLLTTASDYARFVQTLMDNPGLLMLKPALQVSDYVWRGLGIALQKRGDDLAFFHTGANPGFKAVMFASLSAKRGVVSFTNSDGGFPFDMHVVEHALGEQPAVFWLEEP